MCICNVRLNSGIGYIGPNHMLARRAKRDPRLEGSEARKGEKRTADSAPVSRAENEEAGKWHSGKPTFLRRVFRRGSPRTNANSGLFRVKPSRTGPARVKCSNRSIVWSLSPEFLQIRDAPSLDTRGRQSLKTIGRSTY